MPHSLLCRTSLALWTLAASASAAPLPAPAIQWGVGEALPELSWRTPEDQPRTLRETFPERSKAVFFYRGAW